MGAMRARFAELVSSPRVPLGEGCLVIAAHVGRRAAVDEGLDALDALAAAVLAGAPGDAPLTLDDVAAGLFGRLGFRGDQRDYGAIRNSLLPDVVRRRTGIPITLSVVFIEVAARLGAPAHGVGMPGHFLVGDGRRDDRWYDCFDGGVALDLEGARARFAAVHGPSATFDPAFLQPTAAPQILARVLNNLANVQRAGGDPTALVRVLELRDLIPGVAGAPRALP